MRFSFSPARLPIALTAATVTVAAMLTGGAAVAATTADEPTAAASTARVDSRVASAVSGPITRIAVDADSALVSARAAIAFAANTEKAVADSGLTVEGSTTINTSELATLSDSLSDFELMPLMLLPEPVSEVRDATDTVNIATGDLTGRLEHAKAVKAVADAAAAAAKAAAEQAAAAAKAAAEAQAAAEKAAADKAAAEAAAAEKAAASSSSSSSSGSSPRSSSSPVPNVNVNVDPGSAQGIARQMLADRGWGDDQFSCLVSLWNKESGWRVNAHNPSSGAYGIPQSLPGNKMASAGADWQTNPATQIAWGLGYIGGRYGTPCGAWNKSQASGWY